MNDKPAVTRARLPKDFVVPGIQLVPVVILVVALTVAGFATPQRQVRNLWVSLDSSALRLPVADFTAHEFTLQAPSLANYTFAPSGFALQTSLAEFWNQPGNVSLVLRDQNASHIQPMFLNATNAYIIANGVVDKTAVYNSRIQWDTSWQETPFHVHLYENQTYPAPILNFTPPSNLQSMSIAERVTTFANGRVELTGNTPLLYYYQSGGVPGTVALKGNVTINMFGAGMFVWLLSFSRLNETKLLGFLGASAEMKQPSMDMKNLDGDVSTTEGVRVASLTNDGLSGIAQNISLRIGILPNGKFGTVAFVGFADLNRSSTGAPLLSQPNDVSMFVNYATLASAGAAFGATVLERRTRSKSRR